MAIVYSEEFEAGLGAWTTVGTPSTGAAGALIGAAGLVIDTTAGSATQYIQRVLTAGTRIVSLRFYVNVNSQPVGSPNMAQGNCAAGDCKIALHSSGAVRVQVGAGTTQISSVLSAGWHRIDALFNTSASPATLTWQVDGVAQTQATNVQTATDMTALRVGMATATTGRFYIDSLVYGNATGDYPFGGASVTAAAVQATGVGSTPTAQNNLLVTAPLIAAGTGAASVSRAALRVSSTAAAGTGAAGTTKATIATTAQSASGTGSAGVLGKALRINVVQATGAGAAANPTVTAVDGGVTGTYLTITMALA